LGFDLVLRQAMLPAARVPMDIGIAGGRIVAVGHSLRTDGPEVKIGGRLVFPGFVDSHLHLDKSCIMDRCSCSLGTLEEAISEVSSAKRGFTEEDIYQRAEKTLLKAIAQGTNRIRTHVEVDPRIGLKGFTAIRQLKAAYQRLIDIQICVFPQEGLLNDPGTEQLLEQACINGADLLGGCPYTDSDPAGQIARMFAMAKRFAMDLDFHLDFDLDPSWTHLDEVRRHTIESDWGGRVTVGHVTKLAAMDLSQLELVASQLADAGIAVTALPATDLFLMGRNILVNRPRGVAPLHLLAARGVRCSIATNNVLNPFTPFGDCSLGRMANMFANISQSATDDELRACFDMASATAAGIMNLVDYGVSEGMPAHLIVMDCSSAASAVAEIAQPLLGLRHGEISFTRAKPLIHASKSVSAEATDHLFQSLLNPG
jgi:cytosine deaminase